jgi:hypothetical protein
LRNLRCCYRRYIGRTSVSGVYWEYLILHERKLSSYRLTAILHVFIVYCMRYPSFFILSQMVVAGVNNRLQGTDLPSVKAASQVHPSDHKSGVRESHNPGSTKGTA